MKIRQSIGFLAAAALVAGALVSGQALGQTKTPSGYTLEDFQLRTTQDLFDICNLDPGAPDYVTAKAFCYGFIEGAAHYDEALEDGTKIAIVCAPDTATREQAVEAFTMYVRANPGHLTEKPIDTVFRAIIAKWPCAE